MSAARAVIFVPAEDWRPHAVQCLEHIERREYEFCGIVRDWAAIERMRDEGAVDVVVVATREHLPPDRIPRTEAVSDYAPPPAGKPRNAGPIDQARRSRLIRRDEG